MLQAHRSLDRASVCSLQGACVTLQTGLLQHGPASSPEVLAAIVFRLLAQHDNMIRHMLSHSEAANLLFGWQACAQLCPSGKVVRNVLNKPLHTLFDVCHPYLCSHTSVRLA